MDLNPANVAIGGVILMIFALFGIIANVIIIVIYTRKKMRSPINVLLTGKYQIQVIYKLHCHIVIKNPTTGSSTYRGAKSFLGHCPLLSLGNMFFLGGKGDKVLWGHGTFWDRVLWGAWSFVVFGGHSLEAQP